MVSLWLCIVVATLLLYIPGTLFFRAIGFSRLMAVICAPIFSLLAYALLPILYYPFNVPCTVLTVLVPSVLLSAIVWILSSWLRKPNRPRIDIARSHSVDIAGRAVPFEYLALSSYLAVAFALCAFVFGSGSIAVDGFADNWDNQTHINLVKSFLDSHQWSSLHRFGLYLTSVPDAIPITSGPSFYPSALHDLIALVCMIAGASVVTAYNATIGAFLLFVCPSCAFLFFASLFPQSRSVIASGAAVFMAFGSFPWVPVFYIGPITPFLVATTCSLAFSAVVLAFVQMGNRRSMAGGFLVFCCVSAVSLALSQPSALFTAYIFLGSYSCHFLAASIDKSDRIPNEKRLLAKVFAVGGLAIALIAFLVICFHLPFMKGIVRYPTRHYRGLQGTAYRLVLFALSVGKPQVLLALVTAIGLYGLFKMRNAWLLVPFVYMALAFIGVSTKAGPLHSLDVLAGFWYNNYHRIGVQYALFAMPIAAIGLSYVYRWAMNALRSQSKRSLTGGAKTAVGILVMLILFVALVPISGAGMYKTIRSKANQTLTLNEKRVYSISEIEFVDRVLETIPEGALVLNAPNDGSAFAYGVNGLNVYFRRQPLSDMTEDAKIISASLKNFAEDSAVREAVERVGAEYVLVLDQNVAYEDGIWINKKARRMYKTWLGISTIADDTPGFETVLAEGDMRLFKITG